MDVSVVPLAVVISAIGAIINGVVIIAMLKADMRAVQKDIGRIDAVVSRAHQRIDGHLEAHAGGKV